MTVAIAIGMTGPIGREMTVAGDWDDGSGTIAVAMNFFIPRGAFNTRGSGTFAIAIQIIKFHSVTPDILL